MWRRSKSFSNGWLAVVSAVLHTGCGRYWVCDEVDPSETRLPPHLSETGLYLDVRTGELAPGVLEFSPRFPLWSDGSEKRRFIWLPEGKTIDSSNPDDWLFPEGTKVWKQFSSAKSRLETRLLAKLGPDEADWATLSYVWNDENDDATAAPLGAIDVHRTDHDVPAAGECVACHGGRHSFILGFSAIQLATTAAPGQLDLAGVVDRGWLSAPPETAPQVPGNAVEVAALGYLHANCGHCHNQARPARSGARCFDPKDDQDFTLPVTALDSVESTPTYRTAVGHSVKRGDPGDSKLYRLMSSRGMFRQMPPLATEKVDSAALANVRSWIEEL